MQLVTRLTRAMHSPGILLQKAKNVRAEYREWKAHPEKFYDWVSDAYFVDQLEECSGRTDGLAFLQAADEKSPGAD